VLDNSKKANYRKTHKNSEKKARYDNIQVIRIRMKYGLNVLKEQCVNVRSKTEERLHS
jgi:hypothetical protein